MTSIYDIPYEDIKEFLLANNKSFKSKDEAYNIASILLKDKKAKGHPTSIIEWMMARNLLTRKINIPNYSTYKINKMSQVEINQLAKLLTMSGNNINNIKNILRYLHKLDDESTELVSDVKDIILQNLNDLEINQINFETLKLDDVINLLKTHRNKALIRKQIYDNMEKIILNNFLNLDVNFTKLDDLSYIESLIYKIPKDTILELIKNNEKRLLKNHTIEEINSLVDYLNENKSGVNSYDLYQQINFLVKFLINLIEIKEISLAKKVFDIANKHRFIATIAHHSYSFNNHLLELLANQKDNVFNVLLNFIGEDDLIIYLDVEVIKDKNTLYIKRLLNITVKLEKYELFMIILNLLIINDYRGSEVIKMMLPRLTKAIESNNNNLMIKYLNILNLALEGKLRLGGNSFLNIDNLIKTAEQEAS